MNDDKELLFILWGSNSYKMIYSTWIFVMFLKYCRIEKYAQLALLVAFLFRILYVRSLLRKLLLLENVNLISKALELYVSTS